MCEDESSDDRQQSELLRRGEEDRKWMRDQDKRMNSILIALFQWLERIISTRHLGIKRYRFGISSILVVGNVLGTGKIIERPLEVP